MIHHPGYIPPNADQVIGKLLSAVVTLALTLGGIVYLMLPGKEVKK